MSVDLGAWRTYDSGDFDGLEWPVQQFRDAADVVERLAQAILRLADSAGMPDSFWTTDTRIALAREVLGVPDDGRYSHAHLWKQSEPPS